MARKGRSVDKTEIQGALAGLGAGFFFGLFRLAEFGEEHGLWPLLIGAVGGAAIGLYLVRFRAVEAENWSAVLARFSIAFACAASLFVIPGRLLRLITLGEAWLIVGFGVIAGLGCGVEWLVRRDE